MMMMKSVFWWRKPEYPEETTGLQLCSSKTITFNTSGASGADPGFLKGGSILGLQAKKKRGGVQEGVQLWTQC